MEELTKLIEERFELTKQINVIDLKRKANRDLIEKEIKRLKDGLNIRRVFEIITKPDQKISLSFGDNGHVIITETLQIKAKLTEESKIKIQELKDILKELDFPIFDMKEEADYISPVYFRNEDNVIMTNGGGHTMLHIGFIITDEEWEGMKRKIFPKRILRTWAIKDLSLSWN